MRAIWSKRALEQVSETADYIEENFGNKSRRKFVERIFYVVSLLENNPNLGRTEQVLEDAPIKFRSILADNYNRIIYHISDSMIEITDVWDMRRDTNKLKKRLI